MPSTNEAYGFGYLGPGQRSKRLARADAVTHSEHRGIGPLNGEI